MAREGIKRLHLLNTVVDSSRRKYLGAIGTLGAAGFAGCSSLEESSRDGGESEKRVAWPAVTSERLKDWTLSASRRQQLGSTSGVRPYARTRLYDNETLRESIKEKTLGQFDQSLAMFFATHIKLDGIMARFASRSDIAEPVFAEFRSEMAANGITNIDEVSVSEPKPEYDSRSTQVEYRGEYGTPAISKPITIDGTDEQMINIPSQRLDVTGIAASWQEDENTWFAAGGVFPAENYETTNGFSISGDGETDGIDIQIAINLGIPYEQLRRDVVDLAGSVILSDEKA